MSGYEQYAKPNKPKDADNEAKAAYERTVTRLDRLAKQVADTPRGQSLAGKVCIVTGVGSLKGIGSVLMSRGTRNLRPKSLVNSVDSQLLCCTPEKVVYCKFSCHVAALVLD
jgi:hypothetical protein